MDNCGFRDTRMILVAILVSVLLSAPLGALGGYWLMERRIGDVLRTAAYSSQRANTAAATVEAIGADWPGFLERVEGLDRLTEEARDVVPRQDALEGAIAGAFNISVRAG